MDASSPPDRRTLVATIRDYVEQLREEGMEGLPASASLAPRAIPAASAPASSKSDAAPMPTELFSKYPRLEKSSTLDDLRVYICNVIKSGPPDIRNPEPDEVAACEPFLFRQIDIVRPRAIVGLGTFAVQAVLKVKIPISKLRGNWQDFRGIRFMPTFHPAYLLRNPSDKRLVWADIQEVMKFLGMPIPRRGGSAPGA